MSKFKKEGSGGAPAMNTASLPDIVFMLLFFFMVATTSKETDPTVEFESPTGTKKRCMLVKVILSLKTRCQTTVKNL